MAILVSSEVTSNNASVTLPLSFSLSLTRTRIDAESNILEQWIFVHFSVAYACPPCPISASLAHTSPYSHLRRIPRPAPAPKIL